MFPLGRAHVHARRLGLAAAITLSGDIGFDVLAVRREDRATLMDADSDVSTRSERSSLNRVSARLVLIWLLRCNGTLFGVRCRLHQF